MIESAEEFKRLRESEVPEEYRRAAHDEASSETWLEVLNKFPELSFWVAQNKTVPLEILHVLADDGAAGSHGQHPILDRAFAELGRDFSDHRFDFALRSLVRGMTPA